MAGVQQVSQQDLLGQAEARVDSLAMMAQALQASMSHLPEVVDAAPNVVVEEEAQPEAAPELAPELVPQQPESGDLVSMLKEKCLEGSAWPSTAASTLNSMRTGEVFTLFRKLGLRTRFYRPTESSKVTPWHARATVGQRSELAKWTRAQMIHYLSRFPGPERRRLMHIYQVHLMPDYLARRAYSYYGLTFLASPRMATFHEGERFVPLHQAQALVLSARPHRFENNVVRPMWDLKTLRFELESDTHRVLLGGNYHDPSGRLLSRCEWAWQFNFAPHPRATDVLLDVNQKELVDASLDLHWEVEQACVKSFGRRPTTPEFPRVWLGFDEPDRVDAELDAPGLQYRAWQEVVFWCQARRPERWERLPCLGRETTVNPIALGAKISQPGNNWFDVAKQLGKDDAEFLLLQFLGQNDTLHKYDGLHLRPLDFFVPGSTQKPVLQAAKQYLDFSGLLGRVSSDPRLAEPQVNTRQARAQVVYLPRRDLLQGVWSDVTYDFTSVPPKLSHKFIEAQ